MPTIAIVGAGPGLGMAVARAFGRRGYSVGLIARTAATLDELAGALAAEGVEAAAFPADAGAPGQVAAALAAAQERFGTIDALQFSPYAGPAEMDAPVDVTVDSLRRALETYTLGAVAAANAVLPGMRERGAGSILFTAGIGSTEPVAAFGSLNAAQAATRNWAFNLRAQLDGTGVFVGHVAIGVLIGDTAPEGWPHRSATEIAEEVWAFQEARAGRELVVA